MKNLTEILEEENFTLNESNEVEKTYEFESDDAAYDVLYKINQNSDVKVSLATYDLEDDNYVEGDDEPVNADFLFSINGLSNETILETIQIIKSY